MKKYLGLIIFLGVAFSLIPSVAQGEEVISEGVNVPLTTEQKRIQAEARLRALEEGSEIKKIEEKVKREMLETDIRARLEVEGRLRAVESASVMSVVTEVKFTREDALRRFQELRDSLIGEEDEDKVKTIEERITGREKALERFNTVIEKAESQKEKVEALIIKFKTKGVEVEKAISLVAEAQTKIELAEENNLTAHDLLSASAEELTEEAKKELQTLSKDIQAAIKIAQAKLNDAAKALRDAVSARQAI